MRLQLDKMLQLWPILVRQLRGSELKDPQKLLKHQFRVTPYLLPLIPARLSNLVLLMGEVKDPQRNFAAGS